jgi:DhnA family fructose-bisphosphate aldolase class Ia
MDERINRQMKRIFSTKDERALCIACDHGLMTDPGKSWLQIANIVQSAIQSNVDGLLLSSGQARRFTQKYGGVKMPPFIVRTDWTNLLRLGNPGNPCRLLPVEQIQYRRLMSAYDVSKQDGATGAIGFLFVDPEGKVEDLTTEASRELIHESHEVGLPCIIEVLPLTMGNPDADSLALIWKGVRKALDLGADAIKLPLTDEIQTFCEVIHKAGRRVLILGGGNLSDEDLFVNLMKHAIDSGADGLLVGRNVCRSVDPVSLISRLLKVVHPAISEL